MIGGGTEIRITDQNRNGRVDQEDFDRSLEGRTVNDGDTVVVDGTGISVDGLMWEELKDRVRNALLAASAVNETPEENQLNNMRRQVANLYGEAQGLQDKIARLNAEGVADADPRLIEANKKLENIRELLQAAIRNLEFLNRAANKNYNEGIEPSFYQMAGITPDEGGEAKATFAMTSGGQGAGAGTGAGTGAKAMGGGLPFGGFPPAGWGAQTTMPSFPTDAYLKSVALEDNILSSFDGVLKNQKRGRELMLLFFYFARMAESGDLGAIYQLMKFLTYVISKDKAKQINEMGKKLIELQDRQREFTNKLMGFQVNANDSTSNANFSKLTIETKNETDTIATSQKLISQMMEEMGVVVETLTNTTKSALDSYRKVLATVSRPS